MEARGGSADLTPWSADPTPWSADLACGPSGFGRAPMAVEDGGKAFPATFLAPRPPLGTYIRRGTPPHLDTHQGALSLTL